MNWLKKLGTILKIIGQAEGFIPLINVGVPAGSQAVVAKVEDKFQKALGVVITIEQAFSAAFGPEAKKGSEKLKAATPFVAQLIQGTDLLLSKKPANEALFTDAVTRMTSAMADVLNSYNL